MSTTSKQRPVRRWLKRRRKDRQDLTAIEILKAAAEEAKKYQIGESFTMSLLSESSQTEASRDTCLQIIWYAVHCGLSCDVIDGSSVTFVKERDLEECPSFSQFRFELM